MAPVPKCMLWQRQKHEDLFLRSLSVFLKGYFCEFLLSQAQLQLQKGAFTLGQGQQGKREEGQPMTALRSGSWRSDRGWASVPTYNLLTYQFILSLLVILAFKTNCVVGKGYLLLI